ncbi:hypothetical protein ACFSQD_16650 [Flavihumibacter stibioxidans]|uniref:N-acetyltransferase domain-containing protein n=1 Tax=Flavihumibacter stibioxidans TaxID=1834163 RepID=A0ABR7M814_9BACT|nr:hypothetical protein [Flavihumibacter stibioxidans]MBC6490761.1 hypothetical protein [Flavihumibacter stibioxidans]
MQVIPVANEQDARHFLRVQVEMNQGNPDFIRPLEKDINEVFDREKNKSFRFGECRRWLLQDNSGRFIGRIAAFTHKKYRSKGDEGPVGGIGFFDCINQQEAANLLFDTARNWLAEKGMVAMDGPINFGERDKWWGLLVEGFQPPPYGMNYNPPYYKELFRNYGFDVFYYQICWRMDVAGDANQLQPKFYEAHRKFAGNPSFEARMVRNKDLDKYAIDFCTVYNKAWAKHEGNKEMSGQQAIKLFRSMKPVLDESLAWITYHNNEPVAMWINIPDLNQIFRYFKGRFGWMEKLRFLWLLRRGVCNRFIGIIYGIVPEFQGTGIDYFMIVEAEKVIKKRGIYKELELMWQGDFNKKMLNISRNLGATESRRLATWRYQFDQSKPFKRHPFID